MTVHPRGRGEHSRARMAFIFLTGSSPRARGTRLRDFFGGFGRRFIPAGAGNTNARSQDLALDSGSSPRARGTRSLATQTPAVARFIPAGAGNTQEPTAVDYQSTVHPRGRGEHATTLSRTTPQYGSSPRARGTRSARDDRYQQTRFIPAGAGNTVRPQRHGIATTVHPRGRGEHADVFPLCSPVLGSSPRARGTRYVEAAIDWLTRFIPAGAGNTKPALRAGFFLPVHPRGRGEHYRVAQIRNSSDGSSPRARGTRESHSDPPKI